MLPAFDPAHWNERSAAHLLNRTGFGATPAEVAKVAKTKFPAAVAAILEVSDEAARFPKPDWAVPVNMFEQRRQMRELGEEAGREKRKEFQREQRRNSIDLLGWWLGRMRDTNNPFREKLTLFWHGNFATSVEKVKSPYLMWVQNETLRSHAAGNFGTMVKAISRDPAMMLWLDTARSRKQKPNENFARELMELFTLGIGNYSETDIQESARAFTGYNLNQTDQTFRFAERQHDDGPKTFMGRTANYDGDGIIDRILEQPVCAKYVVKKLWEFFAYEKPEPAVTEALATTFRTSDYEIQPVLREMFSSAAFYSDRAVRTQIKSPVQWVMQTSKQLEIPLPPVVATNEALQQLGQVPFRPPSVKGWDGGKSWITTATLLYRYNLAGFTLGKDVQLGGYGRKRPGGAQRGKRLAEAVQRRMSGELKLDALAPQSLRKEPEQLVGQLVIRIFQDPLTPRDIAAFNNFASQHTMDDEGVRDLMHLMMSTPQYQLT